MDKTHPFAELLAREVKRRRTELGLTMTEVRRRGGPTRPTQASVEGGQVTALIQAGTLAKYDGALEWPEGTVDAISRGFAISTAEEAEVAAPEVREMLKRLTRLRKLARPLDLPDEIRDLLRELTDLQADLQTKMLDD